MSKNRVQWLERGWQPVYIGFCPNEKAWNRSMKKMKLKEPYPSKSAAACTTFYRPNGKVCCIVTVSKKSEKSHTPLEIMALITHEAVHVFQEICQSIGEDSPSKEFEAYSIQVLSLRLQDAYEKTRRKLTIDN